MNITPIWIHGIQFEFESGEWMVKYLAARRCVYSSKVCRIIINEMMEWNGKQILKNQRFIILFMCQILRGISIHHYSNIFVIYLFIFALMMSAAVPLSSALAHHWNPFSQSFFRLNNGIDFFPRKYSIYIARGGEGIECGRALFGRRKLYPSAKGNLRKIWLNL